MDPTALRQYAARDRERVTAARQDYWAQRFREDPQAVWQAAQGLLAHVRAIRPGFPTESGRAADMADHLTLCARLDRAAHAFTRR